MAITAANGQTVTDEMVARWAEALDRDEWPDGWRNVGEVVDGKPPVAAEKNAVLTLKIPVSMKKAIEREAKNQGMSASAFARAALADKLIRAGA